MCDVNSRRIAANLLILYCCYRICCVIPFPFPGLWLLCLIITAVILLNIFHNGHPWQAVSVAMLMLALSFPFPDRTSEDFENLFPDAYNISRNRDAIVLDNPVELLPGFKQTISIAGSGFVCEEGDAKAKLEFKMSGRGPWAPFYYRMVGSEEKIQVVAQQSPHYVSILPLVELTHVYKETVTKAGYYQLVDDGQAIYNGEVEIPYHTKPYIKVLI